MHSKRHVSTFCNVQHVTLMSSTRFIALINFYRNSLVIDVWRFSPQRCKMDAWDRYSRSSFDRARTKVGGIKKKRLRGVAGDNKFVRHAVELTIDKAVIPLGSRYFTKKPRASSWPQLSARLSVRGAVPYISSRLFSYSAPLSRSAARVPLITALSLVGVKGTDDAPQEKESSSRLSSRFPLNFDSAFFYRRSGPLCETLWGGRTALKEWSLRV